MRTIDSIAVPRSIRPKDSQRVTAAGTAATSSSLADYPPANAVAL